MSGRTAKACGRRSSGPVEDPRILSPCRSDPDPIRQVFAKPEHFLRKDRPRTRDGLWRNVGAILKKFRPEECANCLVNSGYAAVQLG